MVIDIVDMSSPDWYTFTKFLRLCADLKLLSDDGFYRTYDKLIAKRYGK